MGFALVAIGGLTGTVCRYLLSLALPFGSLLSIMFINGLGSFIIGVLIKHESSFIWGLLGIGFCGAFTTFSMVALDSVKLIQHEKWGLFFLYLFCSNSMCILGCWLGVLTSKFIGSWR